MTISISLSECARYYINEPAKYLFHHYQNKLFYLDKLDIFFQSETLIKIKLKMLPGNESRLKQLKISIDYTLISVINHFVREF